jgi:hypothetical protein
MLYLRALVSLEYVVYTFLINFKLDCIQTVHEYYHNIPVHVVRF